MWHLTASRTVPGVADSDLRRVIATSRRYQESADRLDLTARDEAIKTAVVQGHPIDEIAEAAGVTQEEIVRVVTST